MNTHAQPAAGWQDTQMAVIADAEKPSALVRFVFLPELRKLVEAAARSGRDRVTLNTGRHRLRQRIIS